jgi:allantoinase
LIVRDGFLALSGGAEARHGSIRVRGERIAEIGELLSPEPGEEVVDASGLLVLPGAIDPHVHFDEPGFTFREDFLHGSAEAARGGVTTVVDMPCTSLPPVVDLPALQTKLAAIGGSAVVDYALFGGVSGQSIEKSLAGSMADLAPKVVGFKCYFMSGMETFARVAPESFARIVLEAERVERPILLHAEDCDIVTGETSRMKKARGSGVPTWQDYAASRPEEAEIVAAAAAVSQAREHERSLHVVHVGTAAAARLIAASGASCETCPHYLAFSREDFEALGASLKTAPVVKGRSEREALWSLLADGTISFVASDHAPCRREEKETGDVWTAYGGIPGVGVLLPYLLSEGLFAGRLTLPRLLDATAGAAARRYGLWARKGSLAEGKDADFVLVDSAASTVVEGSELLSKGRVTPFEGMRLKGAIRATYVRGRLVYSASRPALPVPPALPGIAVEPGYGRFLSWGYE